MQLEPLHVTNRVVAVVAPTAPFVEWINAADPSPPDVKIALGVARDDPTAFPIPPTIPTTRLIRASGGFSATGR